MRLSGLALMSVVVLTAWIIIAHQLWQSFHTTSLRFLVALYNATTIVTVATGVIFAYALIYLALLFEASVFMPPSRLESLLQRATVSPDYLTSAIVAASIGTLAAALGAGLENTEAIRKATFGRRQQRRFEEYEQARKKEDEREQEEEDAEQNRCPNVR